MDPIPLHSRLKIQDPARSTKPVQMAPLPCLAPPAVTFSSDTQGGGTAAAGEESSEGGKFAQVVQRRSRSPLMPRPVRPGSGGAPAQRGVPAQKGFGSAPRLSNTASANGGGFLRRGGGRGASASSPSQVESRPGLRPQTATRLRLLLPPIRSVTDQEGRNVSRSSSPLAQHCSDCAPRIRPPATVCVAKHARLNPVVGSQDIPSIVNPPVTAKAAIQLRRVHSDTVDTSLGVGEGKDHVASATQTGASMSPGTAVELLRSALLCLPSREPGRGSPELRVCDLHHHHTPSPDRLFHRLYSAIEGHPLIRMRALAPESPQITNSLNMHSSPFPHPVQIQVTQSALLLQATTPHCLNIPVSQVTISITGDAPYAEAPSSASHPPRACSSGARTAGRGRQEAQGGCQGLGSPAGAAGHGCGATAAAGAQEGSGRAGGTACSGGGAVRGVEAAAEGGKVREMM